MNFQRGREREPLEINLVPLIDVMMVIIIFLMITTTYSRYTELQINLPSVAEAEKQPERANEVSVLVNAQGQYVVNRRPVPFRTVDNRGVLGKVLLLPAGPWGGPRSRLRSVDAVVAHDASLKGYAMRLVGA